MKIISTNDKKTFSEFNINTLYNVLENNTLKHISLNNIKSNSIIIASYFDSSTIQTLDKLGIKTIILKNKIDYTFINEINISIKPKQKTYHRGIGCGRGYSNGKGFNYY